MAVKLDKIYSGLSAFGRNPGNYPLLRLKKLDTLASPGVKSLMYKGIIEGETDNYLTYVQFFELDYSDKKDNDYTEAETVASKLKYHKKPSMSKNPVKIKCSCTDFRFCFEKELYDGSGLIGNYRTYTRVSPPSGRPPKNPGRHLGMCKHVHNFINILHANGRITS